MSLTTELLKKKIQAMKAKASSSGQSNLEWPNCTFPPEGNHKGRFIVDPNGDLYTEYWSYGYFAKGIRDPQGLGEDELPEGFDKENFELKKLAEILADDYHKWGRKAKKNFLCYWYLIETDSKSDNWKPGTLYCLICNSKFATAFNGLMSGLEDSIEELVNIMDPEKPSRGVISMSIKSGVQGSVQLSYVPKKCEPIVPREYDEEDDHYKERLGKLGYRPLEQSYIRPGFNNEKYEALCKQYREELEQLSGQPKKNGDQTKVEAPVEPAPVVEEPVVEQKKLEPVDNNADPFAKFRRK